MGTFDDGPAKESLQHQETHDETVASNGSSFGADHLADNDLLSAITPVPWHALDSAGDTMLSTTSATCDGVDSIGHDGVDGIGHTLDQLTSATNLFDVPPFDLDTPIVS
jgi:hypothetical protein